MIGLYSANVRRRLAGAAAVESGEGSAALDSGGSEEEPLAGRAGRTMAIGAVAGTAIGALIGTTCSRSTGARAGPVCQDRGTAMLRMNRPPSKSKYGHHGLRVFATNRPSLFRNSPKRAMSKRIRLIDRSDRGAGQPNENPPEFRLGKMCEHI
jgi:hypothetical protein